MDLETRVALLEQAVLNINQTLTTLQLSTLPNITSRLETLENQIVNINTTLFNIQNGTLINLQSQIDELKNGTADIQKLIEILYNFSKAKYNFVEYSQAEIDFYKGMQELKGVEVVG